MWCSHETKYTQRTGVIENWTISSLMSSPGCEKVKDSSGSKERIGGTVDDDSRKFLIIVHDDTETFDFQPAITANDENFITISTSCDCDEDNESTPRGLSWVKEQAKCIGYVFHCFGWDSKQFKSKFGHYGGPNGNEFHWCLIGEFDEKETNSFFIWLHQRTEPYIIPKLGTLSADHRHIKSMIASPGMVIFGK